MQQTSDTLLDAYSWNGQTYDTGESIRRKKNSFGCDSTVTLNSLFNIPIQTVCKSKPVIHLFEWKNLYPEWYAHWTPSINSGCDSVVQLNLSINSQINKTIVQTSCDAYQWNGRNYSQSEFIRIRHKVQKDATASLPRN
ncbi:MAG: hypothetical protein IPF46_17710 [Saprospiraceae bacterium]|nr:hypothetical protein [Candidatus Vicinibacter affinis]